MRSYDYDTARGIDTHLHSLEALNKLFNERHDAHYVRGERLGDFVILGTWLPSPGKKAPGFSHGDELPHFFVLK